MDVYLVALVAFFVLSADYAQEVNAHGMMVSPKCVPCIPLRS